MKSHHRRRRHKRRPHTIKRKKYRGNGVNWKHVGIGATAAGLWWLYNSKLNANAVHPHVSANNLEQLKSDTVHSLTSVQHASAQHASAQHASAQHASAPFIPTQSKLDVKKFHELIETKFIIGLTQATIRSAVVVTDLIPTLFNTPCNVSKLDEISVFMHAWYILRNEPCADSIDQLNKSVYDNCFPNQPGRERPEYQPITIEVPISYQFIYFSIALLFARWLIHKTSFVIINPNPQIYKHNEYNPSDGRGMSMFATEYNDAKFNLIDINTTHEICTKLNTIFNQTVYTYSDGTQYLTCGNDIKFNVRAFMIAMSGRIWTITKNARIIRQRYDTTISDKQEINIIKRNLTNILGIQ